MGVVAVKVSCTLIPKVTEEISLDCREDSDQWVVHIPQSDYPDEVKVVMIGR